jgi:methylsterol monooxygenase
MLTNTYRNSTSGFLGPAPTTYWGQFDEISQYNVQLSVLERMWAAWYAYMQNDVIATGIMSFVMHELVYFGRSLPWIIIGQFRYFDKYKIQNVRPDVRTAHRSPAANTFTAKNTNR